MRRRDFIGLLGGTATFIPLIAWAQHPALICVLNASSAESNAASYDAFRAALRQLGYVEGRNIRFEYRYADGFLDRLPALAEELVRLNPRVIVSGPLPANLAARKATATIPIVMATGADPVGFGLVQSLHRPGGNVTGLANFAEELASKQIDVIQELLPRLARVAALINVENPLHVPQLRETQAAAAKASLALVHFEFRVPADLEQAFDEFGRAKAEALLVPPDTTFSTNRARIAELAAKARLPAISGDRPGGRERWPAELWSQRGGKLTPLGSVCGQDFEGRKSGGPAGRAADEDRAGDQSQDRQSARPDRSANAAQPSR
jgi:putative ABC transport system substrate-binding protein